MCACQEHKPRLPAAGDHGAPAAVSPSTGQAWKGAQPELPGIVPVMPSVTVRRCLEHVPANAPRQRRPGSPPPASRGRVGRPGRTQPPCGRDGTRRRIPAGSGHPARLRPRLPRFAGQANIRRVLPLRFAWSPSVALKLVQTRVPSGLAASSVGGSRHPIRKRMAAVPRIPGGQRPVWASARQAYPPCECRLPAGLTERDDIGRGDSGHAPGANAEGLDHWSSEPGAASAGLGGSNPGRMPPRQAPDGPFLTDPDCWVRAREQPRSNHRDKTDTQKLTWGDETPGQTGCAARDLNPEPAD